MLQTMAADEKRHVRRVDDWSDLVAVFETAVQVCLLPRPRQQAIETYCALAAEKGARPLRCVVEPGATGDAHRLPDLPGRDALITDMAFLGRLLADLTGCKRVGLRLDWPETATCPRFHVDRVTLRLLCTYRGPGTEYLELPAEMSGAPFEVDATAPIGRADPFTVVLLKGSAWPGNGTAGAVHRSPAVPPAIGRRAFFSVDAVDG
jgi:hypothetical protein